MTWAEGPCAEATNTEYLFKLADGKKQVVFIAIKGVGRARPQGRAKLLRRVVRCFAGCGQQVLYDE